MKIKMSFQFPMIGDARLQRVIEREQTTLTYGLLALFIDSFIKSEWNNLINELSSSTDVNDWPESTPNRLLNILAAHHLHQGLAALSMNTNFGPLETTINSLSINLLSELIEGLLSAFEDKLDTISLTGQDISEAFDKYGTPTETGRGVFIGDQDIGRDAIDRAIARLPHYVNSIANETELRQAKANVNQYLASEPNKNVNQDLTDNIMGFIRQSWQQNLLSRRTLNHIVRCQLISSPKFGQRPIGRLAARVRDYLSLQTKSSLTSAKSQEILFKDCWKLLEEAILTFLNEQDLLKETGYSLKNTVEDQILDDALHQFRSQMPTSLIEQISEKLIAIRDGLKEWNVLFALPDVKVETANQFPELNQVKFLNKTEAQTFLDENVNNSPHKREGMPKLVFEPNGAALISGIRAVDATRASQIGHRILQTTLDWFLFNYGYGHYSNPKLYDILVFCVEVKTPEPSLTMLGYASNQPSSNELLLRHPNNVQEQLEVINNLSKLANKLNNNHPLAKRITKAIYWYRKGEWSQLTEDRLLNFWISLETLLGPEDQGKVIGKIISYRTSLLVPVRVPVDGQITYQQLREWTREFIEDVYNLRNQITHGGIFEGPSFERFVERFGSTMHSAIVVILFALTSNSPAPERIEELLAWIWDRNPDNNPATPSQP